MLSAHLAFAAGTAQAGNHAMTFPDALRALNHRDFRVFWGGQLVSLIGTWMQSVAQPWLVLGLCRAPRKREHEPGQGHGLDPRRAPRDGVGRGRAETGVADTD